MCAGALPRLLRREVHPLPAVAVAPGLGRAQHELADAEAVEGRGERVVEGVEDDRHAERLGNGEDRVERPAFVVLEHEALGGAR
jgi:hypothetical protein